MANLYRVTRLRTAWGMSGRQPDWHGKPRKPGNALAPVDKKAERQRKAKGRK
jgi:hypothetical protein